MDDNLDSSELHELLHKTITAQGVPPTPTAAIIAAGLRHTRIRRTGVAAGALAIVAAVPLAASGIAAGPGSGVSPAAGGAPTTGVAPQITTGTATPAQPATSAPVVTPLPTSPVRLASGTIGGKEWTVSGVASSGNNALTADQKCLNLVLTDGGRARDENQLGKILPYCGGDAGHGWFAKESLHEGIPGGTGTLFMGTLPGTVARLAVSLDGRPEPVDVTLVRAPGAANTNLYVIPVPTGTNVVSFDEYDAQGNKVGSFSN